jgi:hypothetical protein
VLLAFSVALRRRAVVAAACAALAVASVAMVLVAPSNGQERLVKIAGTLSSPSLLFLRQPARSNSIARSQSVEEISLRGSIKYDFHALSVLIGCY